MAREVKASEATASRRRVVFQIVETDGISPALGEAGGQPQISVNSGAWGDAGIGTLSAIGHGRYYADLTVGIIATAGNSIESRYASVNTAECPGDTFVVVSYDPYSDLADIKAKADLLGSAGVRVSSAFRADGVLEIVRGDDYLQEDGREIPWDSDQWVDLTDRTVEFFLGGKKFGTARVIDAGEETQKVRVSVTHVDSKKLKMGVLSYGYQLKATKDGKVVTLAAGRADIVF